MDFRALRRPFAFAVFFLAVIFLISRIYFLSQLPIFTDEAIYLRWAQIALQDFDWIFISLTDGKQPLFIWLVMLVMTVIKDPLVAGRLVSVGAGMLTAIGLYLLTVQLFKNKGMGLMSAFLYIISPFALVYDRLAIYDSLVGALYIGGLYMTVRLVQHLRVIDAVLAGVIIGGGLITKSSAFFNLYLLPVAFMLLRGGKFLGEAKKWIGLSVITACTAYGIYLIQKISPYFYLINQKNDVFVYPFSEWVQHPFVYSLPNFLPLAQWMVQYVTLPILALSIFSFLMKQYLREKLLLIAYSILPFIAFAVFAKVLYPRYLFLMSLPLLPLASFTLMYLLTRVQNKVVAALLVLFLLFYPVYASTMVVSDFSRAPIPDTDKGQFLTGWPSGVGVEKSISYFNEVSKDGKIFIATGGQFGLLPYALEVYFHNNPKIEIKGYWPITNTIPEDIVEKSREMPAYVIFYQPCPDCKEIGLAPETWPLEQVFQIEKKEENVYYTVYRVVQQ